MSLTYEEIELILEGLDLLEKVTKESAVKGEHFRQLTRRFVNSDKDEAELEAAFKEGIGVVTAKRETVILLKAKLVRLKDKVLADDFEAG